ncbi:hypothetical protein [Halocynthiibacter namhaensis]|uniref:hypothetical protein n=1 Tax=Halocynthiibacter namhaensis TaxID=1290553 RepID=UPI000578E9F2|nr:hypothetical protein [Halocynthiibacter namhaensis]
MKIAIHIGAHTTDGDHLLKSLLKDKERLLNSGVLVPGPGKYRRHLREALAYAEDVDLTENQAQEILDTILEGATPDRLVLSAPNFLGFPKLAVENNRLYPHAHSRMETLMGILPAKEKELHLSICNPVVLLPMLIKQGTAKTTSHAILHSDPRQLKWSELIRRLREQCPDNHLVVWCSEDTPLIWPEIMLSVAGLAANATLLQGGDDILAEIMSPDGLQRYQAYMKARAPMSQQQQSAVAAAFLDKFSISGALEQEIDIPGWTDALVEEATNAYEEDLALIMQMPDVDMILP